MGEINGVELFYWVAFLLGLGYALIGVFAGNLGGDAGAEHEVSLEHDVAVEHNLSIEHEVAAEHEIEAGHGVHEAAGAHVSPFNSLTIASFSAALGGFGLIGLKYVGLPPWVSFAFAFVGALAVATVFFIAVVRPLYSSESTSAPDIDELVRSPAEVRTTIPHGGLGEIVYVAGGSRIAMPARSESGNEIGRGTKVAIIRIRRGVAHVVPLYDELPG